MTTGVRFPRSEGQVTRQAHADLPEGTYEREVGSDGFGGDATHFYHRRPPTGWSTCDGPTQPRALDLTRIAAVTTSPWEATAVASNPAFKLRYWSVNVPMKHLVRNADGDELLFVHEGSGALFCDFGHLTYSEGDYLLMPRGTMWRVEPERASTMLLIEATGARYRLPDRGLMGQHALFDPGVLTVPQINDAFRAQSDTATAVKIKRRDRITTLSYAYNPLDAIGWKGTLIPLRLNWRDIRPVTSHRLHLPPSAHTTFETDRFVIATFVPRPIETDPGALKVPFFHSNDDFDELVFFHRGEFFSRDNIRPGSMTFHPSGIPHGPHPKAFETGKRGSRTHTDEVAINIDCRDAITIADLPDGVEQTEYVDSWKGYEPAVAPSL